MPNWFFFAILPLGFGVAFIVGGVHRYRTNRAFLESAHRVPGIVTGSHIVPTTDSYEYFPMLRFRALDGRDIETVGRTRSTSFELVRLKEQQVWVLYDPADPRRAQMDTSSGHGLTGSVGMVAAGCVFALIGIVVLVATVF